MDNNEIFITGYAKLPQGISATELYRVVALGLIVDKNTGIILDADCSLVTRVARDFVKKLVINQNINDIEELQRNFSRKYFGSAKKALLTSLKICYEKFKQIQENPLEEDDI